MSDSVRFTLSMSEESDKRLDDLADTLNTSKAGVMRQGLKAIDFLTKEARKVGRSLLKAKAAMNLTSPSCLSIKEVVCLGRRKI